MVESFCRSAKSDGLNQRWRNLYNAARNCLHGQVGRLFFLDFISVCLVYRAFSIEKGVDRHLLEVHELDHISFDL